MSHWRGEDVMLGVAYNISAEFTDNGIPIVLLVYNNTTMTRTLVLWL